MPTCDAVRDTFVKVRILVNLKYKLYAENNKYYDFNSNVTYFVLKTVELSHTQESFKWFLSPHTSRICN